MKIPKPRKGSFFPSVLERRRHIDQAQYTVVMEAYVLGSRRAVDDLVGALGVGAGIAKSEVSRICAQFDEVTNKFRTRPFSRPTFPYLLCDVTYVNVHSIQFALGKQGGAPVSVQ